MYQHYKLPEADGRQYTVNLGGLEQWLAAQRPETRYEWYDTHECLVCRFHQARGVSDPWNNAANGSPYAELFASFDDYYAVGGKWPWTYGAALQRLRALRNEPRK